jgi:hypothetical protein
LTYHLWSRLKGNPCPGDDPELTETAESSVEEIRVLLGRAGNNVSSSCILVVATWESATVFIFGYVLLAS